MQEDILISSFTNQVKKFTQTVGTSAFGKGRGQLRPLFSSEVSKNEDGSFNQNIHLASQSISTPSNTTKSNSIIFSTQGLRTSKENSLVPEKEHMQADILIFPSTDQVMQVQSFLKKNKMDRGSNKCKEVASLEVGQKLKVTFYNNRTVGKNNNLFSRHLGKIVCDCNMCLLGVSSWANFKEEKLNHTWGAVKDKFESDDMNNYRDHILGWMKEL